MLASPRHRPLLNAHELRAIAVKWVYRDAPADGAPPKLSEAYIRKSATVVDEQLQKSGVQLAGGDP
jgi:hypothetical protein